MGNNSLSCGDTTFQLKLILNTMMHQDVRNDVSKQKFTKCVENIFQTATSQL